MKIPTTILLISLLYSTSYVPAPKRPYECGPVYKKRDVKDYREVVSFINPAPGDIIANVGAINGYESAMMAVFSDGVTHYIQDTDTICLNYFELDKVLNYYSDFKGESLKLSNQFYIAIGSENKSGLKDNFYHKIFSNMALHTFSQPEKLIEELYDCLKPGGILYVRDGFDADHQQHPCPEKGCNKNYLSYGKFIEVMKSNNFKLEADKLAFGKYPFYKFTKE